MGDSAAMATILATATTGISSAVANAIAKAIKASGAIIRVEPEEFCKILVLAVDPVVVMCPGGYRNRKMKYLMSWKGFVFYCISDMLNLPGSTQVIAAKKIWIPS